MDRSFYGLTRGTRVSPFDKTKLLSSVGVGECGPDDTLAFEIGWDGTRKPRSRGSVSWLLRDYVERSIDWIVVAEA